MINNGCFGAVAVASPNAAQRSIHCPSVFYSSSSSCCSTIMAAAGNNIVRFNYTGADGEYIPDEATHITVGNSCEFVRANSFSGHRNIVELVCHVHVEKIERHAFNNCPSLRRVIMPGVKIVEPGAFNRCTALPD